MSKKQSKGKNKKQNEQKTSKTAKKNPACNKVNQQRVEKKVGPRTENQAKYIHLIQTNTITLSIGPAGTGKAQPLDAKVLTPGGWMSMGDLQRGDTVCTPAGNTATVKQVFPQGQKDIYTITFHDGSSTRCCDEHLWNVEVRSYWGKGQKQTVTTAEIRQLLNNNKTVSIPLVEGIGNTEEVSLPIEPYLLGVLLGDGGLTRCVGFSTADSFIKAQIENNLVEGYEVSNKTSSEYDYKIVSKATSVHRTQKGEYSNLYARCLASLDLMGTKSCTKFIPLPYKQASIAQKWALVQGLMDTDGAIQPYASKRLGGSISFTTVSNRLAKDLQEILWSLGATCTITTRIPSYTYKNKKKKGKLAYTLHINHPQPKNLFRLPRKKDLCLEQFNNGRTELRRRVVDISLTSREEAQCILIDDPEHLYITDDYVVTHNTYLAVALAVNELVNGQCQKLILTRPAVEAAGEKLGALPGDAVEKVNPYMIPLYESLGKILGKMEVDRLIEMGVIEVVPLAYMRGRTLEHAFVIMDEAQNASIDQVKMLLTRLGAHSKMVITGDLRQSDITVGHNRRKRSGLEDAVLRFSEVEGVAVAPLKLSDIQRHPLVSRIIRAYEQVNIPDEMTIEDIYDRGGAC